MRSGGTDRHQHRRQLGDEVAAYAAQRGTDFEANLKLRPSLEHSRAALLGLIENARFKNVRVNAGYVRALGLLP